MKALSLTQPWALLVAIGAKKIETRSWQTHYRGPIAIHAALKYPREARDFGGSEPCRTVLNAYGLEYLRAHPSLKSLAEDPLMVFGAIVATAEIHDVVSTALFQPGGGLNYEISERERAFGDYGPERFGWILGHVRPLRIPVPCKGALGLWTVPADVEELLTETITA